MLEACKSKTEVKMTHVPIAHPRCSTNNRFDPLKTHDMVRSLFDPRLKKSFLEVCITASILGNVVLCHWSYVNFGIEHTKYVFLAQYIFWRLSYNLGIGAVLHYQSRYESLTNFAKRHSLFSKKTNSLLSKFARFEIGAKMDKEHRIESYPEEYNMWLLFRQFVDLILMQDFTTYMLYVIVSFPHQQLLENMFSLNTIALRVWLGVSMVLFNIWVKIDAHSVVKDYAWYWGDFFFLQDANLVFDGVFNVFPHPMYSIGYIGYYGLSLISGDHHVLFVSILGHCLQFLFLKYVETPHIEKIYGSESLRDEESIDEKIVKQLDNYSKPLLTTFFGFKNFDKFRPTEYITLIAISSIVCGFYFTNASYVALSNITIAVKLLTSAINMIILYKQSNDKWFTSIYLKNGYNEIYAYQMWQFIYNLNGSINYILLILQCLSHFIQCGVQNYNNMTFGFILLAIQIWCNSEVLQSIKEYGWFYGDFFLPNYIDQRKLKSDGIYRYLNNPERVFGVAGIWGTVLINDFSNWNLWIAFTWTMINWLTVKFIETPHLVKVYGSRPSSSGFEKTFTKYKIGKDFKSFVDKVDKLLDAYVFTGLIPNINAVEGNEKDWETMINMLLIREKTAKNLRGNGHYNLEICNDVENNVLEISNLIEVKWDVANESFNSDDWIGLYKVIETGEDRLTTKISSHGHWLAVSPKSSYHTERKIRSKIHKNNHFTNGTVTFDSKTLFFEEGVYEFRYHSANSHDVLMISKPFKLLFPKIRDDVSSVDDVLIATRNFLNECGVINESNRFDPNTNKYFSAKTLQYWYMSAMGSEVSIDYMKRVNFDIDIITKKVWNIKQVLDGMK